MESKTVSVCRIVMICLTALFAVVYILTDSLLSKAAASFLFFAAGIMNFIVIRKKAGGYKRFSVILLCGLFMAMAGDIVINLNFIAGAALFAVGHILFFASQCFLCQRNKRIIIRDHIIGTCLLIVNAAIINLSPLYFGNALMQCVCMLYAAIISMMAGKSISNLIGSKDLIFRVMLIGTSLFMVSDMMLMFYDFGSMLPIFHILCIITYYAAEMILANSLLVFRRSGSKSRE